MRSTLTRRSRGQTRPHATKVIEQQLLTLNEELELVQYIDQLTEQHLPPKREIRNFALTIAKTEVSRHSVRYSLERHDDAPSPHWTSSMAVERYAADFYANYSA
jgi:hypothetical protein